MVMTGARTFAGNVPSSYRRWWLDHVFPLQASKLAGDCDGGGGILDRVSESNDPELQRLRDFGACWSWWAVPLDQKQQWQARG